jgi:hypothetical protein
MRHLAWLTGCLLVVSCTVNSSNLDVDASAPGTGGHVIGAGGTTGSGGAGGDCPGCASTGGATGSGGQVATGGTIGTGGQTATGGRGGSGRTCAQIENDYATALMDAKACTVSGTDQCRTLVDNSVACPGCRVYVNDGSGLSALKTEWTSSGCAQTHNICPAIACIAPTFSTCQPTGGPKPGPTPPAGTCQPLN